VAALPGGGVRKARQLINLTGNETEMNTEIPENVVAPGLHNNELSDETLAEILTTMLH